MQIGYVSYGDRLTQQKSRSARDYAGRAGVSIRTDADSLHHWITPQGGGLVATSIRGPLTGLGVDLLIVDDPFKDRNDAESQIISQQVYDWFTAVASTRLEPGGSVIVCQTRWHPEDLVGRLLKQDDDPYEYIHLKAINDDGLPLWPDRWTLKQLERRRAAVGEYDWASLYQGEPRLRGSELFREPARYDHPNYSGARIVIAVDPAATSKTKNDYSAVVVLAAQGYEEHMICDVIEVVRVQKEIPELCLDLEQLQSKYAAPIHVEAVGVGKAVGQMLRSINSNLIVKEINNKADKFTRAQPVSAAWNSGRVRVPISAKWLPAFLQEVTTFTGVGDKHDDMVDALAHAFNVAASAVTCGSSYSPIHDDQLESEHEYREKMLEEYVQRRINEF